MNTTCATFLLAALPAMQNPPAAGRGAATAAATEVRRLEDQLRAATSADARVKAVQAYRQGMARTADLEACFPLNALESELVRVVGIEKSMRAGPYGHHTGHHVIVVAPQQWLEALGGARGEAMATLDAGFVLLEDLTGCDLHKVRGRRLVFVFSPDHPKGTAQTLEAVVWMGFGYLSIPLPYQVMFHEMGHELFPPHNLRPRHESFNEMWPELGRAYVSWSLGMRAEFDDARNRSLASYQEKFLRLGLPLEHLGPYEIGAGMLQSVVDAALRRGDAYDWEPLRRFFRAVLPLPETDSFFQKQETLAFLLQEHLGNEALVPLERAGFVLRPERRALVKNELVRAVPLYLAVRAALDRDDEAAANAAVERLAREFTGSPWTSGGRTLLANWLIKRDRGKDGRAWLARAGHVRQWHVIGPFPNPGGSGCRTAYPPEASIDLAAGCEFAGGKLTWQPLEPRANGYVDLDGRFTPNDEVTAYAVTEIKSARARRAALWTASDDSVQAWINGEPVVRRDLPRGCFPDNERTPISLRAGTNTLLLKIGDLTGGFGFTCRITDENDVPLDG